MGIEEGIALLAEHDKACVALLVAQSQPAFQTINVIDLRVDSDFRRQGLAMAMLFQTIAHAREKEMRAVQLESRTDNQPLNSLMVKAGFDLAGLDTQRRSNHDLVKESATLFWYSSLD
jgi:ribosomal protein S18 acetylase RimI-like enzyme